MEARSIHTPPADFVAQQIAAVTDDVSLAAIKTGMLGSSDVIRSVIAQLATRPAPWLVVDPVMVATSGDRLLAAEAETALREQLLPLADVLTPNLPEAEALLGRPVASDIASVQRAAQELAEMGPRMVYLKGGHETARPVLIGFGIAALALALDLVLESGPVLE